MNMFHVVKESMLQKEKARQEISFHFMR